MSMTSINVTGHISYGGGGGGSGQYYPTARGGAYEMSYGRTPVRFKTQYSFNALRQPIPFCWGPNGSMLLLLMMLGGYSVVAGLALWLLP